MSLDLLRFLAYCLIFVVLIPEVVPEQIEEDRSKGDKNSGKRLSKYNIPDLSETNPSDMKAVLKFIKAVDERAIVLARERALASFLYRTNLTEYNKKKMEQTEEKELLFLLKVMIKKMLFDWRQINKQNASIYRWFKLTDPGADDAAYSRNRMDEPLTLTGKSMAEIFNDARFCPSGSRKKSKCSLTYNPGVKNIMAISRNPEELKHIWKEFRDKTGKKMRNEFIEHVETAKRDPKTAVTYSDSGGIFQAEYECKSFANNMAKIMRDIQPFYTQFHAYIRRRLIKYYNLDIPEDSPIPAHLTGDLYAEKWSNIYDIVNPFPGKETPNVTEILIKNKMEPLDLFVIAEQFFLSIGLERMTPYFWAGSLFVKPDDREVDCEAEAMDLSNGKDFRIIMCAQVDSMSFTRAHHEMGHIEYFMLYTNLLDVFRKSANPGFKDAVGEVFALSSMTPDYLKSIKLMDIDIVEDEEFEIAYLVKIALEFLPTAPYAYIVDLYRYGVYNRSIPNEKINWHWWKYRLDYQGVCPPVERTEEDFDPGAKYHVANKMEYMRYFFGNILMFQIHKSICKEVGHIGLLHKCNIYGKKKAGDLLRKVLSLGRSVHWNEVMLILTNNETSRLQSGPILEYFKPLLDWLKKENEDERVGWNSENPMICP